MWALGCTLASPFLPWTPIFGRSFPKLMQLPMPKTLSIWFSRLMSSYRFRKRRVIHFPEKIKMSRFVFSVSKRC